MANVTRDRFWKLLPGLLFYNLIGRHLLWRRAKRQWIAEGHDLKDIGFDRIPPFKLADIKSIPIHNANRE